MCPRSRFRVRTDRAADHESALAAFDDDDEDSWSQDNGVVDIREQFPDLFVRSVTKFYKEITDMGILDELGSVSPFDDDDPDGKRVTDAKIRKSLLNAVYFVREKKAVTHPSGITHVSYFQMDVDGVGFSRRYASDPTLKPLQTTPRLLRGALSGRFYGDYDMRSAWPTLGVGVCIK